MAHTGFGYDNIKKRAFKTMRTHDLRLEQYKKHANEIMHCTDPQIKDNQNQLDEY